MVVPIPNHDTTGEYSAPATRRTRHRPAWLSDSPNCDAMRPVSLRRNVAAALLAATFAMVGCTAHGQPRDDRPSRSAAPSDQAAATPSPGDPAASASTPASTPVPARPSGASGRVDLTDPRKKEIAMELVSSAENSSLDWRAQYGYIEDIRDGRGYTGGIIGFCSGTHDMLELVRLYTQRSPNNVLAKYLPALKKVDGGQSHAGLDPTFTKDWK